MWDGHKEGQTQLCNSNSNALQVICGLFYSLSICDGMKTRWGMLAWLCLVQLSCLYLLQCDILTFLNMISVFKDTVEVILCMSPKPKLLHNGLSQEAVIRSVAGRKTRWDRLVAQMALNELFCLSEMVAYQKMLGSNYQLCKMSFPKWQHATSEKPYYL